jgi:hypothetical protein
MTEKSLVNDEAVIAAAAALDEVVDPALVVGVVAVFFDELHAASPAAVTTATDQIATRLGDSFMFPLPLWD